VARPTWASPAGSTQTRLTKPARVVRQCDRLQNQGCSGDLGLGRAEHRNTRAALVSCVRCSCARSVPTASRTTRRSPGRSRLAERSTVRIVRATPATLRRSFPWAAILALCVALSVLLHHTAAGSVSSAPHSTMYSAAAQVSPSPAAAGGSLADAPRHARPVHHGATEGGGCGSAAVQLCAASSIDVVVIAPPVLDVLEWVRPPRAILAAPLARRTVGRDPPDLSLLSVLRI